MRDRPWAKPAEYTISAWKPADLPEIIELWKASGQPFFTNPEDPRNQYTLLAREPESGRLMAVITGRVTAELMLVVRPSAASPLSMLAAIYKLWKELRGWLWGNGIADVHAPVYKENKTFYEIARRAGFKEDDRLHLTYDIRKAMETDGK